MTILDGLASLKPGSFHIYFSGGFAFATGVWIVMDLIYVSYESAVELGLEGVISFAVT